MPYVPVSVGRTVHYHAGLERGVPCAGIVTQVWTDGIVNVTLFRGPGPCELAFDHLQNVRFVDAPNPHASTMPTLDDGWPGALGWCEYPPQVAPKG